MRCIDLGLLIGVDHLHQQAALWSLAGQFAQQPQLDSVVIRVVVLFADQHPWRGGQAFDQLLWGQGTAGGQFADHSQFGVIAPLCGNRCRGWQYLVGLAGRQ
ncbi:hypothetical protein D3C78_906910 [compost metagenome]